jgi:hypothetical protein
MPRWNALTARTGFARLTQASEQGLQMRHTAARYGPMVGSFLLLTAMLPGCPSPSPDALAPVDFAFTFRIREDGRGVTASATLAGIESEAPQLTAGDSLSVNGIPLEFDGVRYAAEVPATARYTFVFNRSDGGRFLSAVDAPRPARITAPSPGETVSRRSGFVAAWDPRGASEDTTFDVELDLGITCGIIARAFQIQEGSYPFYPDELVAEFQGETRRDQSPSCGGVIARSLLVVTARRSGRMDPALTGDIEASVDSVAVFNTIP